MKNKKLSSVLMYLVLFIVFVALFLFLRWFYSTRTETTYERPTTPVEVTTPKIRTLTKQITLSSYVSAEDTVAVVPYLDGTILTYNVQEGDYVNEGDIIATIDPEPYELQRKQAEAAYLGYQNAFEKVEKLYLNESASKQDYDSVKAQRDAYKAQLELAELQLSYTNVKAKTSGTILKTLASQGGTAAKGTPIAIIANLNDLTVNLNLGEQYFGLFSQTTQTTRTSQAGSSADDATSNGSVAADNAASNTANNNAYTITVTRPAGQYSQEVSTTATVKAVSPYVDSTSRNFKLYLKLDDPSSFNPGMYVKVTIAVETQTGYSIERKAMKLDGSAYYVQVAGTSSNYTAKNIDLSNVFSTSEYVIVPDEYKDEMFIVKGQNDIFSGQPVAIVDGESTTSQTSTTSSTSQASTTGKTAAKTTN